MSTKTCGQKGGIMKLVNTKTSRAILEFKEGKPCFYSKFLENEMRQIGIEIPHGLRGSYQGKTHITLDDTEFERAFKEIYYTQYMNPSQFKWQERAF
jgi:hypothetical protein